MKLIAVTAFFNPMGWRSRVRNFRIFRDGLKEQGVPLCVAECKRPDDEWNIGEEEADFCFRYEAQDFLWQKERLFNLSVRRLPADCVAVVLVDADVIFKNPDWARSTLEKIESGWSVVQPFKDAYRVPKSGMDDLESASFWRMGYGAQHALDEFIKPPPGHKSFTRGHPGYAMAFNRELIEKVGLYEKNIVGGGDTIVAVGTTGDGSEDALKMMGEKFHVAILNWRKGWQAALNPRQKMTFVPGNVVHLWHGGTSKRKYGLRYGLVAKSHVGPNLILTLEGEPLKFAPSVPADFRELLARYFRGRQEDS